MAGYSRRYEMGDLADIAEYENEILPIEMHGPIGGETPDPKRWVGTASIESVNWGDKSPEEYEAMLPHYYYPITPGAYIRCPEKRPSGPVGVLYALVRDEPVSDELIKQVFYSPGGRFASKVYGGEEGYKQFQELAEMIKADVEYKHLPEYQAFRLEVEQEPLGPQVFGGTSGLAICIAAAEGIEPGTTLEDIMMGLDYSEDYLRAGSHKTDGTKLPAIGCKAVDLAPQVTFRTVSVASLQENDRLLRVLIGDYPQANAQTVFNNLEVINRPGVRDVFFMKDAQGVFRYQEASIKALHGISGEESVEINTGGDENAAYVLVNPERGLRGTTFHKNLWDLDNIDGPQAWNFDIWRSREITQSRYENDDNLRMNFLISRCLYVASTLQEMLKGDQKFGVRKPLAA
jgi:hypothetical protein